MRGCSGQERRRELRDLRAQRHLLLDQPLDELRVEDVGEIGHGAGLQRGADLRGLGLGLGALGAHARQLGVEVGELLLGQRRRRGAAAS